MGAQNCLLKIMSLWAIILHKTDFAIFTVLSCVNSWARCLTDKYLWKTSSNKLRGKFTTPATSKQQFFVTLVNAVNYCHKEIYYRCFRCPRYASETSYYKFLDTTKSMSHISNFTILINLSNSTLFDQSFLKNKMCKEFSKMRFRKVCIFIKISIMFSSKIMNFKIW